MTLLNRFPLLVAALCLSAGPGDANAADNQEAARTTTFPGLAPNLAVGPGGTAILSYLETRASGHALVYRLVTPAGHSQPQTVASGDNWFINWADFPSVVPIREGLWAAHWLVRRAAGGYAYDIYASVSQNGGRTWSEPFLLHDDGTDTEHGFVTLYPSGDAVGAVWLDGRNMSGEHGDHGAATDSGMSLRSGVFDTTGKVRDALLVDGLTCDCCQTDVALTSEGPLAVYRDRSEQEVRDIYVSRLVDGAWRRGKPVNDDTWNIAGCPVNGPVVQALNNRVVVSWFTAANDKPRVKSAWSNDSGETFGPPITVSESGAMGYVGSAMLEAEETVVTWLCKSDDAANSICYRTVRSDGQLGVVRHLPTPTTVSRMSVPQVARLNSDLIFAWTEKIDHDYRVSSTRVPVNKVVTTPEDQ